MALFTGRGDDGTTKTYGCNQRISKSSAIAEALGSLDEINSFLGLCKVKSEAAGLTAPAGADSTSSPQAAKDIIHHIQQTLFVVQTELAGYEMTVSEEKVVELSNLVNEIEKELPPIKTFFISGGTELAATFDVARTLARRAERRVVGVLEANRESRFANRTDNSRFALSDKPLVSPYSLAFLNRLSSVLYALARLANKRAGISETPPDYNGRKEDPTAPGAVPPKKTP